MNKIEFDSREQEIYSRVASLNSCHTFFNVKKGVTNGHIVIFRNEINIPLTDTKEIFIFFEVAGCIYFIEESLPILWEKKADNQYNQKITRDIRFSNTLENFFKLFTKKVTVPNTIRPSHYGGDSNPFEPIKIISHYKLNFNLGNSIKYLLRAGKKEGKYKEDLQKAMTYIQFEIDSLT